VPQLHTIEELVQRLMGAVHRMWDISPGRVVPHTPEARGPAVAEAVSALDELAMRADWRVIANVLDLLVHFDSTVVSAAERMLAVLEGRIPVADLPQLEAAVRSATLQAYRWHELSLAQVRGRSWSRANTALFTLHPSGYVRQWAVEALDSQEGARPLAYLLLRLNDWVEQVRRVAETAVRRRLRPDQLGEWTACLGLLGSLESRRRADHAWVVSELATLLREPAARRVLEEHARSPDRDVARTAFRIALGLSLDHAAPFIEAALSHPDPAVRFQAARQVRALAHLPGRDRFIERMSLDYFMPVRREALYEMADRPTAEAVPWLMEALLDRHPSMRDAARVYLRQQEGHAGFDAREFYLDRLRRAGADATAAMVAGVGETARPEDAEVLVPYLRSRRARVATAALRAIWSIDPDRRIGLLQDCLKDTRPAVAITAARLLEPLAGAVDWDRVRSLLSPGTPEHNQRAALRVLLRRHPHEAMPDIVAAACSPEPTVAEKARDHLTMMRGWRVPYGPSPQQATAVSHALDVWRGRLPANCEAAVRRLML
jgi:HEAT repeat protein